MLHLVGVGRAVSCSYFVVAIAMAGCGDGSPKTYPVQGTVTFDGKSLESGSLVFKPDSAKGNALTVEPAAEIGPDGTYALVTGEKQGAPLGWYLVAVVADAPANEKDPYAVPKSLIPAKYRDATTSPLSVEVVDKPAPSAYDLKLVK